MVYELRTYQLTPGGVAAYVQVAKNTLLPAMAKHGVKPIGFWYTEIGTLNEVTHLWAYNDLTERQRLRASWQAEPGVAEAMVRLREVVVKQHSKVMLPTEISPLK